MATRLESDYRFGAVLLDSLQELWPVEIFVGGSNGMGEVILTATSRGNPSNSVQETYTASAGVPSIMLVDDDDGADYETYMLAAIDSAGYKARHWDADSPGRPGPVQLDSYWRCSGPRRMGAQAI